MFWSFVRVLDWISAYTHKEGSQNRKFNKFWDCEYVEDFLLITTRFLFAAQIHSKGGEIDPLNWPLKFRLFSDFVL